MTNLRPYRQRNGSIVWMTPRQLGSIVDTVGQGAGIVAATVNTGLLATAGTLAVGGPIGIIAGALVAAYALVKVLDKSDERKQIAAQRGEYEKANKELIGQNFQLENKIKELNNGLSTVRVQLKQNGLAGPSNLGFCLVNCAYNAEKDAFSNAKNTFDQLQYENTAKRAVLTSLINDFKKLQEYLGLGVTYLQKAAKNRKVAIAVLGGLAAIGVGVVVYSISTTEKRKTKKIKS